MEEYQPQSEEIVQGPIEAFVKPDIKGVFDLTREAMRLAETATTGLLIDPVVDKPFPTISRERIEEVLSASERVQKLGGKVVQFRRRAQGLETDEEAA